MKKIIFGLSLLMSIVGTTDSLGSTNRTNNQSKKTVIVTNHTTSVKNHRDTHCTCKNCIDINKRNQHDRQMAGGYTQQRSLTRKEKLFFMNTYNGKEKLTPITVATQVVNGTNYKFICKDKHGCKVTVIIYQSLPHQGSKSKIVSVSR